MSVPRYLLVIVLVLLSGLVGGAIMGMLGGTVASKLAHYGIMPKLFREHAIVWKGFEVVDKQGKRRVLLDKYSLTFFNEDGEQTTQLSTGGILSLTDKNTNSGVTLNPGESHVISFARNVQQRYHAVFLTGPLEWRGPGGVPKLGVYRQDGKVVWEVPGAIDCPDQEKILTLAELLPLAERLSPAEKLQLIEHFARELRATTSYPQAQS